MHCIFICRRKVVLFSPTSQGRRYRSARIAAAAADLVIIAIYIRYIYIFFFSPFDSRIYCDPTAFDGTFNMREYTTLAIFHWLNNVCINNTQRFHTTLVSRTF